MDPVLEYFMEDMKVKHQEMRGELSHIRAKLEDLHRFKAEMVVSARFVSFLVSAACGLLTLLVTLFAAGKL